MVRIANQTAAPVEAPAPLTPAERRRLGALEKRIQTGMQTFRDVGMALLEVRDSRLYRESHSTFEDYARERWQLDKTRAYQFIGAAEVVKHVGEDPALTNEAQARELVPLLHEDPAAVTEVWEHVKESGRPVTAALIREKVAEVTNPAGEPEPTVTEALVSQITRLSKSYQRWRGMKPTRREKNIVAAAFAALNEVVGA